MMGFLDFFKKPKKKVDSNNANQQKSVEKNPVNNSISCTPYIADYDIVPIPNFPEFKLHPDLEGLIWFADGPMKNYTPGQDDPSVSFMKNMQFSTKISEEHSAIYTSLPIAIPNDLSMVPRPPYYPRYDMLTPEQRWLYLLTLSDPYGEHDVGYAFILYYGLERHLVIGDFDRAFDVILKMRKVYKNGSFQAYSAYALVLSSVLRGRLDKIADLQNMKSNSFPFDLTLVLHSIEKTGVSAKELMENSRSFGFTNRRYITSDPDLFLKCLNDVLNEKFHDYYMPFDIPQKTMTVPLFANPSFLTTTINIPDFLHDSTFTNNACNCLQEAHDKVKLIKAEMRKNNF